MHTKPILIVDDEKNIRLTLSQALEPLKLTIHTAINGEEALARLARSDIGLMLLDLKMPGMDGMQVLHHVRDKWPNVRVIIITAHGTIESAVEAMKLGAVDFIRKPFSPTEIRMLVKQVMEREALDEQSATDYRALIELSKRHITDRRFEEALAIARKAIAEDPSQPEGFNLIGAMTEIQGDWLGAEKFYRAALDLDPTYKPALMNLERVTSWFKSGEVRLGTEPEQDKQQKDSDEKDTTTSR